MANTTTEAADCISCYREEILIYLVQRFGTLSFAQRVFAETERRLGDCEVLNYVPNPHIYLIGYVLSLGLEFMQADMAEAKRMLAAKALANSDPSCAHAVLERAACSESYVRQGAIEAMATLESIGAMVAVGSMAGGELWQAQAVSTVH